MYINIDPNGPIPIYIQIIKQIKNSVAAGLLAPGDKLPSVRELSRQLSINPNTISRVYQELERDGIIQTVRGVGTFVEDTSLKISEEERYSRIQNLMQNLLTEAYHLRYSKEDLKKILLEQLESWNSGQLEDEADE